MKIGSRRIMWSSGAVAIMALAPFTVTPSGVPVLSTACADEGATCCAQEDAACIYVPCRGWGPFQTCDDPIILDEHYFLNGGGPCPE